jgi:hypothetical protein
MGECVRANPHVLDSGSDYTLSDPCHETIVPCQCMFNLIEQRDLRMPAHCCALLRMQTMGECVWSISSPSFAGEQFSPIDYGRP